MDLLPDDKGTDTQGGKYSSIQDLWAHELGKNVPHGSSGGSEGREEDKEVTWYPKAVEYWNGVPATIDGMMGGLTEISKRDLRTSHDFLTYFLHPPGGKCPPGRKPTQPGRAIDCGAGIGRVTSNLLLPLFNTVDLVEQNSKFVEEARRTIKSSKMRHFYCSGLQDFTFPDATAGAAEDEAEAEDESGPGPGPGPGSVSGSYYDVVWVQWVIGHLHDHDLVTFLKRAKRALTPASGLICIKDNTCEHGFVFDKEDSSVTRSDKHLRVLFEQAELEVVKVLLQPNFPKKLFPVRIYALH